MIESIRSRLLLAAIIALLAVAAALTVFITLCFDRLDTQPSGFPRDPFADKDTYQDVINRVMPGEWKVIAFHRTPESPGSRNAHPGIALGISKHRDRNEILFLYHYLRHSGISAYSLKGPKGSPQSLSQDDTTRLEWRTREPGPLRFGYWHPRSAKVGSRYELSWPHEQTTVTGKFKNYDVSIYFDGENREWIFKVEELSL